MDTDESLGTELSLDELSGFDDEEEAKPKENIEQSLGHDDTNDVSQHTKENIDNVSTVADKGIREQISYIKDVGRLEIEEVVPPSPSEVSQQAENLGVFDNSTLNEINISSESLVVTQLTKDELNSSRNTIETLNCNLAVPNATLQSVNDSFCDSIKQNSDIASVAEFSTAHPNAQSSPKRQCTSRFLPSDESYYSDKQERIAVNESGTIINTPNDSFIEKTTENNVPEQTNKENIHLDNSKTTFSKVDPVIEEKYALQSSNTNISTIDDSSLSEETKTIYSMVKKFWPCVGSCVNRNMLPSKLVDIADQHPRIFSVECQSPVTVRLVDHFLPDTLDAPRFRPVIEIDLQWLNKVKCLQDRSKEQIICGNVLYFVPPCSVLVATALGNTTMTLDRFSFFKQFLLKYKDQFKPLKAMIPGKGCIVRLNNDIARAILLSQPSSNEIIVAFMDTHFIHTISPSCLYELPELFSPKCIPCNLFLARLHGVKQVATNRDMINTMIAHKFNTAPIIPVAGIVIPQESDVCAVDFGMPGNDQAEWISTYMKREYSVVGAPTMEAPNYTQCFKHVLTKFEGGHYDFNKELHGVPAKILKAIEKTNKQRVPKMEKKDERGVMQPCDLDLSDIELDLSDIVEPPSEHVSFTPPNDSVAATTHSSASARNDFLVLDTLVGSLLKSTLPESHKCIMHSTISLALFVKNQFSDAGNTAAVENIDEVINHLMQRLRNLSSI